RECEENAMLTTVELAKLWHVKWVKTLNTETLQYVERLYKLYAESFPNAEDIGDMEYYYAELLWQRAESEQDARMATERWERAAVAFTDVVKRNKVNEKLRKESA